MPAMKNGTLIKKAGQHKTHEQGADGGACGSRYAGNSSGRRAFFRTHHGHRVRLLVGTSIWLILKRTRRTKPPA